MIEGIVASLLRSLMISSMYLLMAIGLTLTYAASRYPNFAHGELMTAGAYSAVLVTTKWGWDFYSATALGALTGALTSLAIFIFIFNPFLKKMRRLIILLVASIAVGLILRNIISIIAKTEKALIIKHNISPEIVTYLAGAGVTSTLLSVLPASLIVVFILYLILMKTKTGLAMRALANNGMLAQASGANTDRIQYVAWTLGGALAGIAGSYWGWFSGITPFTGFYAFMRFFAASVLGGMVSIPGTIIGAYIVGFTENTIMDSLNMFLGVPLVFKPLASFMIAILVLLLKPTGLSEFTMPSFNSIAKRIAKVKSIKNPSIE